MSTAPDYYIVVKKDKNEKFTIENEIPRINGSTIKLNTTKPTEIINDRNTDNIFFPIKVVIGNNMYRNEFEVNGVKYSLDLDAPFTEYETNGQLIDDKEFINMHKAYTQLANSNNNNNNNNNTSTSTPITSAQTNNNNTSNNNNNTSNNNNSATPSDNLPPPPTSGYYASTSTDIDKLSNILGGNKQKQRRSKRNYSKKQRKQWAKNNTLRNYFNYRESAH